MQLLFRIIAGALLLFSIYPANYQTIPVDTLITLERTQCYGPCPSYELRIASDGKVIFVGHRFVRKEGKVESRITLDQLRQLISEFEKIDYFSLKDDYGVSVSYSRSENCPEWWTDHSAAYTSLTLNGKTKKVAHYHGCKGTPDVKKLDQLEDRIDEIVNTKPWVEK